VHHREVSRSRTGNCLPLKVLDTWRTGHKHYCVTMAQFKWHIDLLHTHAILLLSSTVTLVGELMVANNTVGFKVIQKFLSFSLIRWLYKIMKTLLTNLRDSWIKRDQLDVTCFFISLFNVQHVSDVNTSILRSWRLICRVISWVVLLWFDAFWCYIVGWLGWRGIRMQAEALLTIQPMK